MALPFMGRNPYHRRLLETTVGGWRVSLSDAVDALKRILTRRRIPFVDAGGGGRLMLQAHLIILEDRQASLILYHRPFSPTYLSVDSLEAQAEPLVESLVTHLEEELSLKGQGQVETASSDETLT